MEIPVKGKYVEAFISSIYFMEASAEGSTASIVSIDAFIESFIEASIASIYSMEASMKAVKASTEAFISFQAKCK